MNTLSPTVILLLLFTTIIYGFNLDWRVLLETLLLFVGNFTLYARPRMVFSRISSSLDTIIFSTLSRKRNQILIS